MLQCAAVTTWMAIGGVVLLALVIERLWRASDRRVAERAEKERDDVLAMGDVVPASLHPKIDPARCIGSGACVAACPEHDVIGVVGGRATLVNPLACIGHGACLEACPVRAIELVFGTESRGLELPRLDKNFETTQPGLYVIGELGGMGLIRNAVSQGAQAAEHVVAKGARGDGADVMDAIVVGAGPAGIAATLELVRSDRRVVLLEAERFGGTIAHYPRKKLVMTGDVSMPIYGRIGKSTMTKEQLADLLVDIRTKTGLAVREGEHVTEVRREASGEYVVRATSGMFRARNVLLALGRRGSPSKLGVPGEELSKVSYRLLEPEAFEGRDVLVVGGGNSAVECALLLADAGTCKSVTISYRREAFARCRAENRRKIDEAIAERRVRPLMSTQVARIGEGDVLLRGEGLPGGQLRIRNDAVIIQIGGTSPTELLGKFGIQLVTKYGER